ncbi:LisH dimerisation motif [Plasmopara halstedii]|uniref:LisH dimerisation motif n=1 Tax=Plasmopara halstedii TaxID=4781 RepID=A0A0P1ABE4_PLAHL|nr:LisH dimerisation motif [Plasmopara halstedii]CEG38160.1 LisH dimerisation motif [Plasmopara halstedii]|eukprot:XP_024574529.1 LisH dimerisation motif [Plasmopara halstedii]
MVTGLENDQRAIEHGKKIPFVTGETLVDKVKTFVLQLMQEFLAQHKFVETLAALQAELDRKGITISDDQLWEDMCNSCRGALTKRGSSTLEKLIAFCGSTNVRTTESKPSVTLSLASHPTSKSNFQQTSLSLNRAYNQMLSPVVRPSQRHKHEILPRTSQGFRRRFEPKSLDSEIKGISIPESNEGNIATISGVIEIKQHLTHRRKHQHKKSHTCDHDSKCKVQANSLPTSTFMTMTFNERMKRDVSCGRIVARDLRHLRNEQRKCELIRRDIETQQAALLRHDSYTNEVARAQYGSVHRLDCALCSFLFLPVNLPYIVSFKCIMDLHACWGYQSREREVAARYRPPLCYDAVRVCRMCGPILFSHTTASPLAYDDRVKALMGLNKVDIKTKTPELTLCSDPYALPPLDGNDVIEDDLYIGGEEEFDVYQGSYGILEN